MIARVIPILAFLTATPAPHPAQANGAPAGHCVGSEYRQFDFWVGSWDVYPTGQSQLVAHSLIETVYNGCGVRENWMPLKTEKLAISAAGSAAAAFEIRNAVRQTREKKRMEFWTAPKRIASPVFFSILECLLVRRAAQAPLLLISS